MSDQPIPQEVDPSSAGSFAAGDLALDGCPDESRRVLGIARDFPNAGLHALGEFEQETFGPELGAAHKRISVIDSDARLSYIRFRRNGDTVMTFQLDTAGFVQPAGHRQAALCWSDLNSFTQGYVEALFASFRRGDIGHWPDTPHAMRVMRFDRLAPEALARIMEDCAAFSALPCATDGKHSGASFWSSRQNPWHERGARDGNRYWDAIADFPPLTPYLGDDGKVYLRETGQ